MTKMKIVTGHNCERIVEVFVEEYMKIMQEHGDKPFDDKFRLQLLDMLSKAFVAYALFMGFDLKTTQGAIAGFWSETSNFVLEIPDIGDRH